MSDRSRGAPRSTTAYLAYDDYEDSYATPRSRGGRSQQPPYSERGYRPGKYQGQNHMQYQAYVSDYPVVPGPSYGPQQGWVQQGPTRAPYATGYPRQYPDPYSQPPESARSATERSGSRWGGSNGGRPPSARPPSSSGGGGLSTGRALNSVAGNGIGSSAAGGRQAGGNGRPAGHVRAPSSGAGSNAGSARQPSRGRTNTEPSSAGSSGGGGRSRSNSRAGGSARVRAPYLTAEPASMALVPAQEPEEPAAPAEPELPSNPHFMTPAFPQAPRTRTDSFNTWALMVEASSQTLESVVGPFLEGVLMELFGESWEQELSAMELSLPPFTAATCAELVGRCKQLHERLPITIHKRVEAVSKATASLASCPSSLEPEDVVAAHTAMKGMLQDCIKAMRIPSLLGEGSRQFHSFVEDLLPHAESTLLYYDMLLADCAEATAARQKVRSASADKEDDSQLLLGAAEAVSP